MSGIWFDQDNTEPFNNSPLGEMNTSYFDEVVDNTANTQVSRYFMCPGSSTAIFDGKYNEVYAKGFDLSQGPEQDAICGNRNEWLYRFAYNLHSILAEKIDPVQYILSRARQKGMEAWLTMRMNDIHCGEDENSPVHCSFWKKHPEYRISEVPYENALSFEYPEVRELVLNRAFELIERYNADGFQMDWTRFSMFFPHGKEEGSANLITDMVRKMTAKAREKNMGVGVRVPGKIDVCLKRGLDVINWIREGLIDYIVIAPFLSTDFDLPVAEWKAEIGNPEFPIRCGLDGVICSYPGGVRRKMNSPEIRGACASFLSRGANVVYLFNFYGNMQANYPNMFNEIGLLETLKGKDRTYRITWHDNEMTVGEQDKMNRFPGWIEKWRDKKKKNGCYPFALPSIIPAGKKHIFTINSVVKPEPNAICKICVEFFDMDNISFELLVNDTDSVFLAKVDCFNFIIDRDLIRKGENTFTIKNTAKNQIEVTDLQLKIYFGICS